MELDIKNQYWMGKIPDSWETKKIKFVLSQRNENNVPIKSTEILSLTAKQGVIPYSEKEGGGNKPKQDFSAYKLTYPGDIVMNSMNILSGAVGLSKYMGCISPVYYALKPKNNTDDVRFFYYVFANKIFQSSLLGLGNGILIKQSDNGNFNTIRMRIPIEKINNLSVPYPSPSIQQQIADFLDHKTAEIGGLIDKIHTEIDTLKQYQSSVITQAVTKGLDPNVPMKDSGIEWIGEIPEKWKVAPLYKYFSERKNKNRAGNEKNLLSLSYGRIVRKNIESKGGLLPESFTTYNIIEPGDIIIRPTDLQNDKRSLRTGLSGEHGIITSAYIDLAPDGGTNSKYHHYLLHSYDIQKVFYNMGNGVRQGLNYSEFSKLKVLVPERLEQQQIVDYLDNKVSQIQNIIKSKQQQIDQLTGYKNSLIFEYVTGKKQVKEEN